MLKTKRGITLISLVITIVVLLILTSGIVIQVDKGTRIKEYKQMCADINILQDRALIYYKKYAEAPIKGEIVNVESIFPPETRIGNFYEIDLEKLPNLTLHFGTPTVGDENNKYIINEKTLDVYYLKGVEYNQKIVYGIEK